MKPLLVLSTTNPDGTIELNEPERIRRVIRPTTARAMRMLLAEAVEHGTGGNARIEGMKVSGKTGTSQKVDRKNKVYYQDRFISSFAGFLPSENPELLAVIIIDDPQDKYFGGVVAAPVFKKVMERLLVTVPRQEPVYAEDRKGIRARKNGKNAVVPSLVSCTRDEVSKLLKKSGLTPLWIGDGELAISQGSPPGTAVRSGSSIQVVLGPCGAECDEVKIPNLKGMDLREAIATLSRLGVRVSIEGAGEIIEQTPEAGKSLKVGESCYLRAGKKISNVSQGEQS
jgi:stage V sporulation protein D (sporulation-specific penicillin-binding protein)